MLGWEKGGDRRWDGVSRVIQSSAGLSQREGEREREVINRILGVVQWWMLCVGG